MESILRWLPHGHPLSPGWRFAPQVPSHHMAHALLIEPDDDAVDVRAIADYAAAALAFPAPLIVLED